MKSNPISEQATKAKQKMTRSIILDTKQKYFHSQSKESFQPATFFSMMIIDDKKTSKKQKNKLFDALSNTSQKSKSASDIQISDLLNMTDEEFLQKYNEDLFFKNKLDLRLQKYTSIKDKKKPIPKLSYDNDDQFGGESSNVLTLNDMKRKQEENQYKFYQKYMRVIGNSKKN